MCQSQLIKKSGYSWRDKVPEIQKPLKFSEVRSNAVTDVAFIGSSYVREKEQTQKDTKDKSKCPKIMTKVYKIDSAIDIMKLVIKDDIHRRKKLSIEKEIKYVRLASLGTDDTSASSGHWWIYFWKFFGKNLNPNIIRVNNAFVAKKLMLYFFEIIT